MFLLALVGLSFLAPASLIPIGAPASPAGITFSTFKPTDFPFVTIIPHDGTGPSGWQAAKANLEFTRYVIPTKVIKWYCPITIGMPEWNSAMGKISPITAATMSAAVANTVNRGMDYSLPQGIFCRRFVNAVQAAFPTMYPGLGEKVTL